MPTWGKVLALVTAFMVIDWMNSSTTVSQSKVIQTQLASTVKGESQNTKVLSDTSNSDLRRSLSGEEVTHWDSPDNNREVLDQQAVLSLRHALEFGDPRTPAIGKRDAEPLPTASQLEDPMAYAEFEADQHRQVLHAFSRAAENKLRLVADAIAKGKQSELAEEQLNEGLRKQRALRKALNQTRASLVEPAVDD